MAQTNFSSKPGHRCRFWTTRELALMRNHYRTIGNTAMAKMLNRTKSSVSAKATVLGLTRKRKDRGKSRQYRQPWTSNDPTPDVIAEMAAEIKRERLEAYRKQGDPIDEHD